MPSSIDRILDRAQQAAPWIDRAGDLLLVLCCAGFSLLDLAILLTSGRSETWLGVGFGALGAVALGGVSLVAVAAVALRRQLGLIALVGMSVLSLCATTASLLLGVSLPPSFAVLFALAVLVARALHVEPELPAAGATLLALLAVLGEPARLQDRGTVEAM